MVGGAMWWWSVGGDAYQLGWLDTWWRWLAQVWDDAVWPAAGVGSYEVENIMSSGQGKFPLEVVTDNALLRSKYESQELDGLTPLYVTSNSAQGVGIRTSAASPAILLPIENSTKLRVQIAGGGVYVRTPWDETYDQVQAMLISTTRTAWANNPVEFGGSRRIAKGTAADQTATAWAAATGGILANQGDEAPPMKYNGQTTGGNHQPVLCIQPTITSHGKTDADIGSVWNNGARNYTIVRIQGADKIDFIPEPAGTPNQWFFDTASTAGTTFTHVSGAENTAAMTVQSHVNQYLQTLLNNRSVRVLVNGVEISSQDAVYSGARFEIGEKYSIVNPPSLVTWLKSQAGQLTSNWTLPNSVASDVDVYHRWIFAENGVITNSATLTFQRPVTLAYIALLQALAPNYSGQTLKGYIPDVSPVTVGANTYDFKAIADMTTVPADVPINQASWLDPKQPPSRQAHMLFTGSSFTFGSVIGYSPLRGVSSRVQRPSKIDKSGYWGATSRKNYVHCVTGAGFASSVIPAGTVIKGTAYRALYPASWVPDASVATWHWDGDNDIVVTLDFHKASTQSFVSLPAVAEGWVVTPIEQTNVTLFTPVVDGGQIAVACTSTYGHAQYRVSAT